MTVELLAARNENAWRTALFGSEAKGWRGPRGGAVTGAWRVVTGDFVRRTPHCDGAWWQIDTGAGFASHNRLTILRIDCEPMTSTTVTVIDH